MRLAVVDDGGGGHAVYGLAAFAQGVLIEEPEATIAPCCGLVEGAVLLGFGAASVRAVGQWFMRLN